MSAEWQSRHGLRVAPGRLLPVPQGVLAGRVARDVETVLLGPLGDAAVNAGVVEVVGRPLVDERHGREVGRDGPRGGSVELISHEVGRGR